MPTEHNLSPGDKLVRTYYGTPHGMVNIERVTPSGILVLSDGYRLNATLRIRGSTAFSGRGYRLPREGDALLMLQLRLSALAENATWIPFLTADELSQMHDIISAAVGRQKAAEVTP